MNAIKLSGIPTRLGWRRNGRLDPRRCRSLHQDHIPDRIRQHPQPEPEPEPPKLDPSPGHLSSQLALHTESLDLLGLLRTCRSIKQLPDPLTQPSLQPLLHQAYKSLLKLLGHYGLWTQILLTIKEIDSQPGMVDSLTTDPQFWTILTSGLINSGKAPDVILSRLAGHALPTELIRLLLHASILENNFAQTISCFSQYIKKLSSAEKPDRILMSKLTKFLARHGEIGLAISITNHYILPINQDETELIENLVHLLRASVYRSNPDLTLYCYQHLSENHPSVLSKTLDEGMSLSLLTLAYRHHLPTLSLKIMSSSIQQKREIQLSHLLPTLGTLCRSPQPRMNDVVSIMSKMSCEGILEEEEEWLGYNLVIGHFGGLEAYQILLTSSDSPPLTCSLSLESSIKLIKKSLMEEEHSIKSDVAATILINSLLQALVEIGDKERVLKIYDEFFGSELAGDNNEIKMKNNGVKPNARTAKILLEAKTKDDEERDGVECD